MGKTTVKITRIVNYLGILVLALLSAGVIFEQYSRWKLEKAIFRTKTFVEVDNTYPLPENGQRRYYRRLCIGHGKQPHNLDRGCRKRSPPMLLPYPMIEVDFS